MKKAITIAIISLLIIAGIFVACEKASNVDNNTGVANEIKLVNLIGENGHKSGIVMLEFNSVEHYEATLASLEAKIEAHENDFLKTYGHLSEELLNAKEEEIGFNTYKPLIDFEKQYNIPRSMRQDFSDAQTQWLSSPVLSAETNPMNEYPFGSIEMALLNSNGEVKIGSNILKLTHKGFVYIANTDVRTLIRINSGDITAFKEHTVTTNIDYDGSNNGGFNSTSCTNWRKKEVPLEYDGNKKVIVHVHFHAYPWKSVAASEINSFIKKNNKWKPYRTRLCIDVKTRLADINCVRNVSEGYDVNGPKQQKNMTVHVADWGNFPGHRAINGESVFGTFSFGDGYYTNLILAW